MTFIVVDGLPSDAGATSRNFVTPWKVSHKRPFLGQIGSTGDGA